MPTYCGNCGQPEGECYNLCINSPHYYSPEQERYDAQFYGEDDNRERYAAELRDLELEAEAEARYYAEKSGEPYSEIPSYMDAPRYVYSDDEIPF